MALRTVLILIKIGCFFISRTEHIICKYSRGFYFNQNIDIVLSARTFTLLQRLKYVFGQRVLQSASFAIVLEPSHYYSLKKILKLELHNYSLRK